MKLFLFSSSSRIGLDIQADQIYLIQLKKRGKHFFLERAEHWLLPTDVLREGRTHYWRVVSNKLAECVAQLKLKGLPTAIQLSAQLVNMQCLPLALGLSHEEIEAEIDAAVQQNKEGLMEELAIDYLPLPSSAHHARIFFAAAKKEYVFHYVECIQATGLKVKAVDVDIFAFNRALCFALNLQSTNEVMAIVWVKQDWTSMTIFHGNEILFYQQWETSNVADFIIQFKNRVHLYAVSEQVKAIQRLIMCGDVIYYDFFIHDHDRPEYLIQHVDLSQQSLLLPDFNTQQMRELPSDFFVACGAAMREFPIWSL